MEVKEGGRGRETERQSNKDRVEQWLNGQKDLPRKCDDLNSNPDTLKNVVHG